MYSFCNLVGSKQWYTELKDVPSEKKDEKNGHVCRLQCSNKTFGDNHYSA